jgi:REP element-mobilizing transposase RayT
MTEIKDTTKGYYHRNLPHFDYNGLYQIITYRLNDSLPREIFEMKCENETAKRKTIEKYLDEGYGSCLLTKHPAVANLVIDNWKNFDGQKYDLVAYVVMPNHVHILINSNKAFALEKILHSWKSYTSSKFKSISGQSQVPAWQSEYWDRYIRDEKHFAQAIEYIMQNPIKANLCHKAEDWPYSYCRPPAGRTGSLARLKTMARQNSKKQPPEETGKAGEMSHHRSPGITKKGNVFNGH